MDQNNKQAKAISDTQQTIDRLSSERGQHKQQIDRLSILNETQLQEIEKLKQYKHHKIKTTTSPNIN